LAAALADFERRLIKGAGHALELRRTRLSAAARGLPRPVDLIAIASQSLDLVTSRLGAAVRRRLDSRRHDLTVAATALRPRVLMAAIQVKSQQASQISGRLAPAAGRRLETLLDRLSATGKLLTSYEPKAPLKRGFALVWRADGRLARLAGQVSPGEAISLEFADARLGARVDGEPPFALEPPP
jgi:exodeoxyribonuclease VII large subunit